MGKKNKKGAENRRQKKLAEQKRKRTAKTGSVKQLPKTKSLDQRNVMRFYKEIEKPEVFFERFEILKELLQSNDYFAHLKLPPEQVREKVIPFVAKYESEIGSWNDQSYRTHLDAEVVNSLLDLPYKEEMTATFDRATRSPRFSDEERDSILLGYILTSFEQHRDTLAENVPSELKAASNPIWGLIVDIAMETLAGEDPKVAAFIEIAKELPEAEESQEDTDEMLDEEADAATALPAPELPPAERLSETEIAGLLEQMAQDFSLRFELDEMLHLAACAKELENIRDYAALKGIATDISRKIVDAMQADYNQRGVGERYLDYVDSGSAPWHRQAGAYLREHSLANNPFLIQAFLTGFSQLNPQTDPLIAAIFKTPNDIEGYLQLGERLLPTPGRAVHAFRRAIQVDREDYRGYHGLGQALEKERTFDMAAENYEIAIDMAEQAMEDGDTSIQADLIANLKADLERVEAQL